MIAVSQPFIRSLYPGAAGHCCHQRKGRKHKEPERNINTIHAFCIRKKKLGLYWEGWKNCCPGTTQRVGRLYTQCHKAACFQSADSQRKLLFTVTPLHSFWGRGAGNTGQKRSQLWPTKQLCYAADIYKFIYLLSEVWKEKKEEGGKYSYLPSSCQS